MKPTVYFNQRAFADACGQGTIEAAEVAIHKLAKAGRLPVPDIAVGSRLGWTPQRVRKFGLFCPQGKAAFTEPPQWWDVPDGTRTYLDLKAVSERLGIVQITLIKRIDTGRFIDPAVAITREGHLVRGTAYGWAEPDVVAYGQQYGYLDEDGAVADIRRGGAVRKIFQDAA